MANLKLSLIILAATMGCFMMATSVNAMTHIVGGSHGWRVPDNKTYFEDWARPRTFGVGDRLRKFNMPLFLLFCTSKFYFLRYQILGNNHIGVI